jgi:hypothetical protein
MASLMAASADSWLPRRQCGGAAAQTGSDFGAAAINLRRARSLVHARGHPARQGVKFWHRAFLPDTPLFSSCSKPASSVHPCRESGLTRKLAERPTPDEMQERLRRRDPYKGKVAPTDLVRAERDSR